MARINIEDSIYTDRRFIDLCMKFQDLDKAIGCLVRSWMIAQKWYLTTEKMIPIKEWEKQKISDAIIEVGLAERVGDFIRLCGSDNQFSWLTQSVNAGRKGGQATARRNQATLQRPYSKLHPLTLSLSLNTKENTIAHFANERDPNFSSICAKVDELYRLYPRKLGKQTGMKKLKATIKTESDLLQLETALTRFLKYHADKKTLPEFIPYFSTFVSTWKDWLELETGTEIGFNTNAELKSGQVPGVCYDDTEASE